jgi:hypothetical protein
MKNSEWREQFLEAVSNCSTEGREAVEYIRMHKTRIGIKRARKSVGAFWTFARSAHLNSAHYTPEASLVNPHAWTLLIHEVRHLQQGLLVALSIYGELDAWQYQFQVLKKITGKTLSPLAEEILTLPVNMERENLQRARQLMTQMAGKSYGANLLPLYPVHKEIKYWVTRKFNLRDFFQK